jgi:hypothetical protein
MPEPPSRSQADDAHQVVVQFVQDIQKKAINSKQKKHITTFARWYFSKIGTPTLSDKSINYLLCGDGEGRKGLLESCGNSNIKKILDIKKSSVLALELVVMLLDATVNTLHSEKFLEFLPKVPLKILQAMKLDRHILNETAEPDNAFKLLFMLQEQLPNIPIASYLDGSSDALKAYNEWYADHMEEQEDLEQDEGPRTWSEVKLEDLDREEAQGMEVDLDNMILDASLAEDGDTETLDPLGLTRISGSGRLGGQEGKKKGVSSSKKMKLFWRKLLKQKEVAAAKASKDKRGGRATSPGSPSSHSDDEEEDAEGIDGQAHLIDAIMQKGSINTSLPDFNPVLFLNQVHQQTSLASLEKGLTHLEQSLNDRTAQMKNLVEQHFGQYVFCKDTIDHLHQVLQSEISSNTKVAKSSGRSVKLMQDINKVKEECEELYAPLLQRKTETDQILRVLSILHRFRFLFGLPKSLQERKGGWEQVIRDYQKAKQLVVIKASAMSVAQQNAAHPLTSPASSPTSASASSSNPGSAPHQSLAALPPGASVSLASMMSPAGAAHAAAAQSAGQLGIPESILLEIGTLIRNIRSELFSLLDQPTPGAGGGWEEQEKIIGYLLALDCEQDPAWYYLTKQREAIAAQMEKAMEELCGKVETALQGTNVLKGFTPAQGGAQEGPMRLLNGSIPLSTLVLHTGETVFALSKFLRRLCHLMQKALPEFVDLAIHIETGKYGGWTPPVMEGEAGAIGGQQQARGTVYQSSPQDGSKASPGLTVNLPPSSPIAAGPMSSQASAAASAATSETHSVGRLIGLINSQFVQYVKLTLFPAGAKVGPGGKLTGSPTAAATAAANAAAHVASSSSSPDRPFFSFPPHMYSHVHDILSSIESVRALPGIQQEWMVELRQMGDALVAFYLEQHVRELLLSVASLHKDETWALDPDAPRLAAALNAGGAATGVSIQDELEQLLEDDLPESSAAPLGHGHAGTSATNSAIQVTLLPGQFHFLLRSALAAFGAVPVIQQQWLVERMVGAVFESMKVFADGLHALAISIRSAQDAQGHGERATSTPNAVPMGGMGGSGANASAVVNWVKPAELDRRLLLVWSNALFTVDELLWPLFEQLLTLLPLSTHQILETKFRDDVVCLFSDILESNLLLHTYVKSKVLQMNQIVKKGYWKNGVNWRTKTEQPGAGRENGNGRTESKHASSSAKSSLQPRSCVLELLLQFVLIHDELYTVRKEELDRVMEMILEKVALTLLLTVKQIETGECVETACEQVGAPIDSLF